MRENAEMSNLFNRLVYVCAVFLMFIPLVSCGGGGGGGTAGTGTLNLGLTDATGDYQHVFVTIKEILVHQSTEEVNDDDSGWLPAFPIGETIDLTTLEDGQIMDLGVAELPAGQYNQMRLILAKDRVAPHPSANYVVIEGLVEEVYEIGEVGDYYTIEKLKVPSGFQTGVKIVKGFEIIADQATALILDFDAKKSVVKAGDSGQWLLKPTIKVLDTVNNSISGEVNQGTDDYLFNAFVSAQVFSPPVNPPPAEWDPKDEVEVIGSDTTDTLGDYTIYIAPGTYNVIATMEGYFPKCQVVVAEPGYSDYDENDFTLEEVDVGALWIVSGVVSFDTTEVDDPIATLSIRQKNVVWGEGDCLDTITIELAEVNRAEGDEYSIDLPNGSYQIVAWADGEETLVIDFDVDGKDIENQNITFL
jgi:hypothetical protein